MRKILWCLIASGATWLVWLNYYIWTFAGAKTSSLQHTQHELDTLYLLKTIATFVTTIAAGIIGAELVMRRSRTDRRPR